MAFIAYTQPTVANLTDYQSFLQNNGFSTTVLPVTSPYIAMTFNWAIQYVTLEAMMAAPLSAVDAVYNLATSVLLNVCPDQTGQNMFATLRAKFGIIGKGFGLINSASDQGTSAGYMVPQTLEHLTLQDLENLKNPYGQRYIEFAQNYGSNLWGLT